MELLATALQPYNALPTETVFSILLFVVIAGAAIIFSVREIVSRGLWNQRFQENSRLRLGHVIRSAARSRQPAFQRLRRTPTL
ncbi:MAG: hypothetical protein HY816_22235 [Candidatus Wallbacteria bacterium]|nr:hypothetical protein [Candidatus Wallbacteria bacterium]